MQTLPLRPARLGGEEPMKILIAADGSAYTKHMLAYLAAHDERLGAGHQYILHRGRAAAPRAWR